MIVQGKILIVDAIATNRIMLKVKLGTAFYTVVQAATVAEGVDLAGAHLPNLVITALSLPDGDAADLSKHLQGTSHTARIPVMAIANHPVEEKRIKALKAGVQDVLSKPIDDTLLLSRVRSLIRAHSADLEWQLREDTSRALGFSEETSDFSGKPHCVLVSKDRQSLLVFARQLKKALSAELTLASTADLLSQAPVDALADVYVLMPPADPIAAQEDLHLLSALKTSPQTQHAGVLVLQRQPNPALGAHALDLGADDLMSDGFDATELALRITSVIRRKKMAAQLRATVRTGLQAAVFDPLTGLYNRRYAMPHLDRIVDHARNAHRSFAVLVADLDYFKRVNDAYGHASGDAVLIEVANRLRRILRSSDMVARIGGEEFMIVMPSTQEVEAKKVALRICQEISSVPFSVPGSLKPITVTTSIGMAISRLLGDEAVSETATAMLARADKALYAAKGKGRNQVTLDRPAA
ncbi:MAG: diguanylate cyclase [Pseudomonadota bacterium]